MKRLRKLIVPDELQRNAPKVSALGYEHTGETLIRLAVQETGFNSLEKLDVLDIGCGVRFAMTLINRNIPIQSYTGVEVNSKIIHFLKANVESHDDRFRFEHWNVRNELYNPEGVPMSEYADLPIQGEFDVIWLFSVFTHLNPEDSVTLLRLLKRYLRPEGRIFFSVFIDEKLSSFEDRIKGKPLLNAYYGRRYFKSLVAQAGWKILSFKEKDPDKYIMHHLVCCPDESELGVSNKEEKIT